MAEVYITGIAGFLGKQVAALFMNSGYTVGGCDNFVGTDPKGYTPFKKTLDFFEEEDVRMVRSLPADTKYVIHAAGMMNGEDNDIYDVNIEGTTNIMGVAKEHGARVVNVSNYQAADPDSSAYAHSKWVAEGAANLANAISLRFSNLYGPDQKVGVLADWQRDYAEKRLVTVNGSGDQLRDFLHVSDAAYAVYLAAHYGFWLQGRATDACSGQQTSIRDLVTLCGFPHTYDESAPVGVGFIEQHNDEIYRIVGWTPRVGLTDGLKKMGLLARNP